MSASSKTSGCDEKAVGVARKKDIWRSREEAMYILVPLSVNSHLVLFTRYGLERMYIIDNYQEVEI